MSELKAARAVAEHWRRRYQAGQALIAELQGENEQLSNKLDWAREVVIERWTKADEKIAELQGERDELAAGIHRRDARIAELEGRLQAARDNQPGAMTDEWACAINEVHRLRGFIARVEADRDKLREVVHKQEALLDEYAINAAYEHYPAPIIRAHKHQLPGAGLLGPYTPKGDHNHSVEDFCLPAADDIVDEGRYVRRPDGSFFWWSDREQVETYTPTPDPIQGVEDGWWIGCESWETWDGDE